MIHYYICHFSNSVVLTEEVGGVSILDISIENTKKCQVIKYQLVELQSP